MSHRILRLFVSLILMLAVTAITSGPQPARAAGPWYVAPGGDDIANDCLSPLTPCATINGGIGKASPGDTIYVATNTYTNSTGSEVVLIDKDITLSGGWDAGFTVQSGMSTIDGQSARRGITVNNGVTTSIEHFVIQNGSAQDSGGGIHNNGSLTVNNSNINNNAASGLYVTGGGIFNGVNGTLMLNYSQISDNVAQEGGGNAQGGGIYNDGTLILNSIIVNGNTAQSGGGIDNNFGTLTMTNTSVSDNLVNNGNGGGGILIASGIAILNNSTVSGNTNETGSGGGIVNGGTLNLINSTVSGNTSPFGQGGGIYNYGMVNLNNTTITGNTSQDAGGITNPESGGTATLQNSILAGNTAAGVGPDCIGTIGSSGYNLIDNTSNCTFTPGAGDLTDVNANLGQLIGSPGYHPLLLGSPAIDAGNPAGCTDQNGNPLATDQRGMTRPQGIACDIGAYEYVASSDAATSLGYVNGSNQRGAAGMAFPEPFAVYVLDSNGSPVSRVTVTFTAPASGPSGTFTDSGTNITAALSDIGGVAISPSFTANSQLGSYTVSATVSGLVDSVTFALTNVLVPSNDNFSSAKAISLLPFSDSLDNTEATIETGEPQNCYSSPKTVWYSFTPMANALVRADMAGSGFGDTILNIYQAVGSGIGNLSFLQCASYANSVTLSVQAGMTYYFQAGSIDSGGGSLNLNLQEIPPPANDNFTNAKVIPSPLPFDNTVDTLAASIQAGEPTPSCAYYGTSSRSVWYVFTPVISESISASIPAYTFAPVFAVYTGNSLASLTQIGCQATGGNLLTFHADAGTTYYFQVGNLYPWEQGGSMQFHLDVPPPPVAGFYLYPYDPSVFDTVQFYDQSYDPGNLGFQSFVWDFGDGTTATGSNPTHKYPADGDYTVRHSVTTVDGRTASTSQVVQVRTHDVAITKLSAPKSASTGQTRTITVSVRNSAYLETVQVDLYRSTPGGFVLIGTLTLPVPASSAGRTTSFSFNYTFTSQDAQIGKVTFQAVATILNARDAFPTDNQAVSSPPTKVSR